MRLKRGREKKRWNCRFRDRTVDRAVARTKFERRKRRRPGCLQFFPEVYPRRDLSLFEPSFEASFLHAQTKRNVPGEIQISGVAVIKRNPRYECAGRPCSFRGWCIISLPFVEPAIDLSSIPSFSLPLFPFLFSFFLSSLFFYDWNLKNSSKVEECSRG